MTNRRIIIYLLLAIIGVAVIIIIFLIGRNEEEAPINITTFQDCAAAGYPVLEIYPRQCQTPDGRAFVEKADQPLETC